MKQANQIIALALAAAAISQFSSSTAATAANFFEGKTITIMGGFPAGSAVETFGRMTGRAMARHMPGKPNITMKFMTGGGGVKALNFLAAKAKNDGLTLIYTPWFPTGEVIGDPAQRFKYADFSVVGGVKHLGRMFFGRIDSAPGGIKKAPDLFKATKLLKIGGSRASNSNDLRSLLSLDLLGLKYKWVPGFRGQGKVFVAVFQNEINVTATTIQTYRSTVERLNKQQGGKVIKPLWHWRLPDGKGGWNKNPNATEMPSFIEVYKAVHGKAPSGEMWEALKVVLELHGSSAQMLLGPPGIAKDKLAIMQKAWFAGLSDNTFKKEYMKVAGIIGGPVPTKTALADVAKVSNVDPKVAAYLKKFINSKN